MRNIFVAAALGAITLFTAACKKSDSSPSSSGAKGSITVHGQTVPASVFIKSGSGIGVNCYSSDSAFSISTAILSTNQSGTITYDSAAGPSSYPIILLTATAKNGSGSTSRYYGANGEQITYSLTGTGVLKATNLSQIDFTHGGYHAIPGTGKLTLDTHE